MAEPPRILVVDDNRLSRLKLSRAVEALGYRVQAAEDGPQALALLRDRGADAVLLDIVMPGMDGHGVLEVLKCDPQLRDVPVIIISAVDEVDSVVRAIEMGAEDYLPKSFDPVLLRARLRAGLEKKRLRDLERAYLHQEVLLRQAEKLATLGRLSAGLAHEINNPAAAVRRGAALLEEAVTRLRAAPGLDRLSPGQRGWVRGLEELARTRAQPSAAADPLARSDREAELEAVLQAHGTAQPWEYSGMLADLGLDGGTLADGLGSIPRDAVDDVLAGLDAACATFRLVAELRGGAARISELVGALKSYSYMDQATDKQRVDLHRGIDDTLLMLHSALERGPVVRRRYGEDLPPLFAHGGELNQVWTNLLDNAAWAAGRDGTVTVRTRVDGERVLIEVEDDGPGIPAADQARVFDPFFTTKPPGEGTGLGLAIAHSIVTQRHGGTIIVQSQPGRTRFTVTLPLAATDASTR